MGLTRGPEVKKRERGGARMFSGVGTALTTSFLSDGRLDERAMFESIKMQILAGVDFLVPCGTTGESPTLSHEEHNFVVNRTVILAAEQVPILAGTGSNSTEEAVRLTEAAKHCGADGALVVSPYYNKPTQKGIKLHYRAIAQVGLPIVLYDIPGRCGGQGVSAETILELAHEGTICGLKWASGNFDQLEKVLAERPEGFRVFSGDDNLTYEAMNKGADGVISVLSNLWPEMMVKFIAEIKKGRSLACAEWNGRLQALMKAMFIETNPIPIKTAMAMIWPETFQEVFRLPLCEMEPANREKLGDVLKQYKLL